jgi:hypothetical protein
MRSLKGLVAKAGIGGMALALGLLTVAPAFADDDDEGRHGREGRHEHGWREHERWGWGPPAYVRPAPPPVVYYGGPPPVYYAPPPPVYYAPPPPPVVYGSPSLNVVVPLNFR